MAAWSPFMVLGYWIVPKRGETRRIVKSVGNLYAVQKARHCVLIVVVAVVEVQLVARGESLATHVTMQLVVLAGIFLNHCDVTESSAPTPQLEMNQSRDHWPMLPLANRTVDA